METFFPDNTEHSFTSSAGYEPLWGAVSSVQTPLLSTIFPDHMTYCIPRTLSGLLRLCQQI
jgi:hypothetical protein